MRTATATAGNLLIFVLHYERNSVSEMVDDKIPAHLAMQDAWICMQKVEAFLEAQGAMHPSRDIPQGIPESFLLLYGACATAVAINGHHDYIEFELIEGAYLELKHHIVFLAQLGFFNSAPRYK